MSTDNKASGSIFDKIKSTSLDIKSSGNIFGSKSNKATISINSNLIDEKKDVKQNNKLFQKFLSNSSDSKSLELPLNLLKNNNKDSESSHVSSRGFAMTKADFDNIKKTINNQNLKQNEYFHRKEIINVGLSIDSNNIKQSSSLVKKNKPLVLDLTGDGCSFENVKSIDTSVYDLDQNESFLKIEINLNEELNIQSLSNQTSRDNRLINKMLNDFEFEEFDGDVNDLQDGKILRAQIEKMRDDSVTFDDFNDVADSFLSDDVKKKKTVFRKSRQSSFKKTRGINGDVFQQSFIKKTAFVYDSISVNSLAKQISVKSKEIKKTLHSLGINSDDDYIMDFDTAEVVTHELGHDIVKSKTINEALEHGSDGKEFLIDCCPVVTIMGHVDHGKTTLLDVIRRADVALNESGGITQHIGAYKVRLDNGKEITFIDTPGHAAFTAMRSRGASSTNIVVIVVAADDGIMQQTIEAISHAKAAEVPIIVAINKIDSQGSDITRVKNELLQYDIVPEELGGDVMVIPVSAKLNKNIDALLDAILLQSEVLELKADLNSKPSGVVLEANIDTKVGIVATVLLQNGTLRKGDIILAGESFGKVRLMIDDTGVSYDEIIPQTPIQIFGLNSIPKAGDKFFYAQNEKIAKQVTDYKKNVNLKSKQVFRPNIFDKQIKNIINIIIKSDSQGTNEAIIYSVSQMKLHEDVSLKVIHSGTGNINESDALLSKANDAKIFAFRVVSDSKSDAIIKREKLDVKTYSVIYELLNEIEKIASDSIEKVVDYDLIGSAEVREVFNVSKQGKIAGCYVTKGIVKQKAKVKVIRSGIVVFESLIVNLKRFKENAKEVNTGFECGVQVENYEDLLKGDILEIYEEKK